MVDASDAHAAGLYAIFAAAALIHCRLQPLLATAPERRRMPQRRDDEMRSKTVELDPAITKLDEADIGVSGPEQIEEAIETLDAQTESRPPLVSELGRTARRCPTAATCSSASAAASRSSDVDHAAVEREVRWFASHPAYLDRTFKRGERYLYHIVNEIEARNMPLELALLPVVESAFNPVAYSRARASGLWQFIPGTGRRYGLKQNWYYDGRRDVDRVDERRARLSAVPRRRVRRRLAAGRRRLQLRRSERRARSRAQSRAGKPTDFFSLKLPRETRAYVPKLLAMRRIVGDPTSHGLAFAPIPNQPYFAQGRRRRADRPARRRRARRAAEGRDARAEPRVQSLGHRSGRPASPAGAGRSRSALHGRRSPRCRPRSACASSITACVAATRSAASPTSTASRSRRSRAANKIRGTHDSSRAGSADHSGADGHERRRLAATHRRRSSARAGAALPTSTSCVAATRCGASRARTA